MNIVIKSRKLEFVKSRISSQINNVVFLDKNCPKTAFSVQKRKLEHNHQIQHIRIGLVTKFHLKQTILHFWTNFTQNEYFRSKATQINITMEFSISELV